MPPPSTPSPTSSPSPSLPLFPQPQSSTDHDAPPDSPLHEILASDLGVTILLQRLKQQIGCGKVISPSAILTTRSSPPSSEREASSRTSLQKLSKITVETFRKPELKRG
ncbi:hypothetical protein NEOLI_005449 [Neolecta irregularis DAH-3]|uniref:Uncharacterized protein n=1 Tax=Neolecta irregularis (strain DAH-3) TaxID=1198029 RepID=A0A1U7LL15_NEOID|nr:hypothetical protein NEOLI_005449 [Neolecta irregularis DAH-3]|eukprot:OLL23328.1 hypothetical protein NEOLI_005449 [Neolecta irregularis DAH-3]